MPASLTHQRKKSKSIQSRLAANVPPSDLAAHFHAVILRYFAFHQQIRLHCENEKAVLWTFSITHRRPQLGSCCSAREFCSWDTESRSAEQAALTSTVHPSQPCAEEKRTECWGFGRWDGFEHPTRHERNRLVQKSWGRIWNWTVRSLIPNFPPIQYSLLCTVSVFLFFPVWK